MSDLFAEFPAGFEAAAELVDKKACELAIFMNGSVVYTARGSGIAPLMEVFDTSPQFLPDAAVADKIIGKAAAMILYHAGAAAVYGAVMSEAGRNYLDERGIKVACKALTLRILNRNGDGLCPVEQAVLDVEDAAEGIVQIRQRLAELKSGQQAD